MIDKSLRFSVSNEVAIEEFQDVSILFLAEQLRLLEINGTTQKILELMNGKTSIREIIDRISSEYNLTKHEIDNEVCELTLKMISEKVIYPEVKIRMNGEFNMNESSKYLANPDVSCRIEDEDGAILFNPDSDSTQIINPIGLEIWKSLERHPKNLQDIVSYIVDLYDDAKEDNVKKDVSEFVENLYTKGFLGEVVDE